MPRVSEDGLLWNDLDRLVRGCFSMLSVETEICSFDTIPILLDSTLVKREHFADHTGGVAMFDLIHTLRELTLRL